MERSPLPCPPSFSLGFSFPLKKLKQNYGTILVLLIRRNVYKRMNFPPVQDGNLGGAPQSSCRAGCFSQSLGTVGGWQFSGT